MISTRRKFEVIINPSRAVPLELASFLLENEDDRSESDGI
jgi:hypothetical protein